MKAWLRGAPTIRFYISIHGLFILITPALLPTQVFAVRQRILRGVNIQRSARTPVDAVQVSVGVVLTHPAEWRPTLFRRKHIYDNPDFD